VRIERLFRDGYQGDRLAKTSGDRCDAPKPTGIKCEHVTRLSTWRSFGLAEISAVVLMVSVRTQSRNLTARGYDRVSRVWDRFFVPATAQARDHMIRLARLKPGERVLDIGTGTGASAILAARKVGKSGKVLGIDLSKRMLAKAREKASRLGLVNVEFRLMDSTSLRLPEGSFDAIITTFGTPEGLYSGRLVLREWLRVLAAGGRLCLCEGADDDKLGRIIERVFDKYKVAKPTSSLAARRTLQALISKERKRRHQVHFSNARRVTRELRDAGFSGVKASTRVFAIFLPSARVLRDLLIASDISDEYMAMPPENQRGFKQEFISALRPFESSRGLLWGDKVVFVRASKGRA